MKERQSFSKILSKNGGNTLDNTIDANFDFDADIMQLDYNQYGGSPTPPPQNGSQNDDRLKLILTVIAAVLFVVVLIVGILLAVRYFKGRDDDTTEGSSVSSAEENRDENKENSPEVETEDITEPTTSTTESTTESTTASTTESTTASTTESTTESTTPPSKDQDPVESADVGGNSQDIDEPKNVANEVPATPDAVCAAYVKAVNDLKHNTGIVTVHKVSNVDLYVTDCSVGAARGIIDGIVQKFVTDSDDTWTFSNGSDPDGRTLTDKIVPSNKDTVLRADQCAQATAEADGDGYTMVILLNPEGSDYDGSNTTYPDAHSSCLDPLNLADMDVSPATITSASMSYPGAAIHATVDGQGRLTRLVVNLPMSGTGTGKVSMFSLTIGLEGKMNETYDMTY